LSTGLTMSKTWPVNRGREDPDHEFKMAQQITMTCGVGACRKKWAGELGSILPKRDAHRAEKHPEFVPPKRKQRRGFTKPKLVDATE